MPFLKINPDNSIADIEAIDNGGVLVEPGLLQDIIKHAAGHAAFDYIDGAIILNVERETAYTLQKEKNNFINELVEKEKTLMAKERLTGIINSINNAPDIAALNGLK